MKARWITEAIGATLILLFPVLAPLISPGHLFVYHHQQPLTRLMDGLLPVSYTHLYQDLGRQMADPEVLSDHEKYQKIAKQHRDLEPVVEKFREYRQVKTGIADARAMLNESDADIRAMAQEELTALEAREPQLEEDLKLLLLPKDPNDEKNVVVEIRAGTGGDEASLFAAEVFRMYTRFAEQHRWKVEVLSSSESSVGGLKEVIAIIEGNRVYSQMKYELSLIHI